MISAALILFAVTFNLIYLFPEIKLRAPMLNDGILHLLAARGAVDAMLRFADPTDPWLATIAMGFPLFHYYQHLPHVTLAGVYLMLGQRVALGALYQGSIYLLLSVFPVGVYWSMRRFGFGALPASMSALVTPLVSAGGALLGMDHASYVWQGHGVYSQLWGMFWLPLALGEGYVALRDGQGRFWAVLLVALTILSHLAMGFITVGSLVLFAALPLLGPGARAGHGAARTRVVRLAGLGALVGLVVAYFIVPLALDGAYLNRSVWEATERWDSFGYRWVLGQLAQGALFDLGRWPVLTLLAAAGLGMCLRRWREERYRLVALLAVLWLVLFFGRSPWGPLLDVLPLGRNMHFHRLIVGLHLGGVYLVGVALGAVWTWAIERRPERAMGGAVVVTALLLYAAFVGRAGYLRDNGRMMEEQAAAVTAEESDIGALVQTLQGLPTGRVYAGLPKNWGREYKVGAAPMWSLLQAEGLDMLGYLYHSMAYTGDIHLLFDEQRPEHYDVFNVRYVVAPREQPLPQFARPVRDFGRHRLYQVATTGYFGLADTALAFEGRPAEFHPAVSTWLASGHPRVGHMPRLWVGRAAPEGVATQSLAGRNDLFWQQTPMSGEPRGRIVVETRERSAYDARVRLESAGTVVLKTTYHPNWRATVDGAAVETQMVMPSYVGVAVPAGDHHVRLEYGTNPLRGLARWVGILVLVVLGAVEWRRGGATALRGRLRMKPPWARVGAGTGVTAARRREGEGARQRARAEMRPRALLGWRTMVGLYLMFLGVYLLTASGHFASTDHVAVYRTTESLVERGSLAIAALPDSYRGPDGQAYSVFGVGQSIASIPLYLLGRLAERTLPTEVRTALGGQPLGMWGGTAPIFFVSLFNQLITPLICVLLVLLALRFGFSRGVAVATAGIYGFATGAWVYARDYFQHPLETLLLVLSIYVLVSNRDRLRARDVALAGTMLALGVMTRVNVVLAAPVMAGYLVALAREAQDEGADGDDTRWTQRAGKWVALYAAPVVAAVVILMVLNAARFGSPWAFNPVAQRHFLATPLWVGLYGNLFSVGRGLFLYSPPVLLGLLAFRQFYGRYRAEAALFAAVIAVYLGLFSTYRSWHGDWTWGPRLLAPVLPLLTLPVAYWLERGPGRRVAALIAALGIGVQIVGVTVNFSYVYWEWLRMELTPADAYLYVPALSPIPTHLNHLLAGRHVDLWVIWLYEHYGAAAAGTALAGPTILVVVGVVLAGGLQHPWAKAAGWLAQSVRSARPSRMAMDSTEGPLR